MTRFYDFMILPAHAKRTCCLLHVRACYASSPLFPPHYFHPIISTHERWAVLATAQHSCSAAMARSIAAALLYACIAVSSLVGVLSFATPPPGRGVAQQQSQLGDLATCSASSPSADVEEQWERYKLNRASKRYQIIAAEAMEPMARTLQEKYPSRFTFHPTSWGKFPDGTDFIEVGGFTPRNVISGEHVLFLGSFHNNDVTLSQFSVMISLLQGFIESLTVVLPYYPTGTMERVVKEGQVATANTYAQLFSNLPSCGKPTRVMVYDLHTLQNRFYLHGNSIASLQTTIPVLIEALKKTNVDCVAFPDDGAAKRFAHMFEGFATVTCGKVRDGDERRITIQDGDPSGRNIVIVDDLVQTGGTLYECGEALKQKGAASVSAFVAHGVFPSEAWKRFAKGGDRCVFDTFWLTNSIPTTTDKLPVNDVYKVLDISEKIVEDLDSYTS
jgi:ribose-phosphate pyrophosphokinase